MIKYINGIIGGGKSGLAVAYIYSIVPNTQTSKKIVKDSDFTDDYQKVYTNISGMNKEDFEGRLEFLNFKIIDKCALVMATLRDNSQHIESIDPVLNKFYDDVADGIEFKDLESEFDLSLIEHIYDDIKGFRFNHVLIVIDEVVSYFDEKKPYLRDWFNYSRHLFQDMILIQNSITDVSSSYKNDETVKHFIRAQDASDRLHPQLFKYAYFEGNKQTKASKPQIKNIWIPSWVFTKYDCGKPQNAFPVIYKYLIGLGLIMIFITYMIMGLLDTHKNEDSIKKGSSPPSGSPPVDNSSVQDKNKLRGVACFRCGKKSCVYKNDVFSIQKFTFYKKRHHMELAYKDKYFFFTDFCYESDEEFFDIYKSKDTNKTSIIGSFI